MGVLRVFHKYLEGAIRSFHQCLLKDSNVSLLCFNSISGCFCHTWSNLGISALLEILQSCKLDHKVA